jgi:hypothetical protein
MRSPVLAIAASLLMIPAARADGCKFQTDGRLVTEREQRAVIEWEDGVETLHVAARADPTTEGTVWIVPIRANARSVQAEPVERFPAVVYYETLKSRAVRDLRDSIGVTGLLNSGGLCLFTFFGGCGGAGPAAAIEESRVEKLGMVRRETRHGRRARLGRVAGGPGSVSRCPGGEPGRREPRFA